MSGRLPKFEEMEGFKELHTEELSGKLSKAFSLVVDGIRVFSSILESVIFTLLSGLLPLVILAVFCYSCYDLVSSNNMDIKCFDLIVSAVMFLFLQSLYEEGGNANVISRRRS